MKIDNMKRKFITTFLVIGVLMAGLLAGLVLVRQSQEIREKAQATSDISVYLSPSSQTINNGQKITVNIVLKNNTAVDKSINVTDMDIKFDNTYLAAANPSCNSNFLSSTAVATISGDQVSLSCFAPGGSGAKQIPANSEVTSGTFEITAQGNQGTAFVSPFRVIVADATTNQDISGGSGTGASYTLQPATGGTTVPTASAGPTSPSSGTPNTCGGTCGSNSNCQSGLFCFSGFCRNPSCPVVSNCNCSTGRTATPKATAKPKASVKGSPTGTPEAITIIETPSPTPFATASPEPRGGGIFNNIFLWIAGGALLLLIILYFLFGRNSDDNPPQITPPTTGGGQGPSTDTVHTTAQPGKPDQGINLGQNVANPPPPPPQQTPPQQG